MRRRLGYLLVNVAVTVYALGCWVAGQELNPRELEKATG